MEEKMSLALIVLILLPVVPGHFLTTAHWPSDYSQIKLDESFNQPIVSS
jgi:hypothetical protein